MRDIQFYSQINERKEELEVLLELIDEGESAEEDLKAALNDFDQELNQAELQTLFIDADDVRNVILTIHPGAGGTASPPSRPAPPSESG